MDPNDFAIRLLCHAAGALLCALLAVVAIRKTRRGMADVLLAALIVAGACWHGANALRYFASAAGLRSGDSSAGFAGFSFVAAAITPALLLHLSALWSGLFGRWRKWTGLPLYPAAFVLHSRTAASVAMLLAAGLMVAAARRSAAPYRRFFAWFAASTALMGIVLAHGEHGTLMAGVSLPPAISLVVFVSRFHVFDLLISRRVLFVFTLALVSAAYLGVVRFLRDWLESEFDAFGPIVEAALILGAAVTWLPMYEVMTRFFSRQSRIRAEFSRRVIEHAAGILDLEQRADYIVSEIGRTFELKRAALVLDVRPPQMSLFGPCDGELDAGSLLALAASPGRLSPPAPGGFNYVFPLRYQDRLIGAMVLDTSPRAFLDETEATFEGLASQISLSVESCRLAESKVILERRLLEQQHLATLGKVAATIAHEVKNPLSAIKTLAQLMREDASVVAQYDQELGFILSETDRLNSCVQQLLTFSRPLPDPTEEVALSDLLEGTAAFLTPETERQGVTIDRRIDSGITLTGADRHSVQQVVINLLLNAVQASADGGHVTIEASCRERDGRVQVSITDSGPGIPPGVRERIFEPFFTTRQQGTGLGLAIVKKNVEHLRAELTVETPVSEGRGTRVSVVFPLRIGAAAR